MNGPIVTQLCPLYRDETNTDNLGYMIRYNGARSVIDQFKKQDYPSDKLRLIIIDSSLLPHPEAPSWTEDSRIAYLHVPSVQEGINKYRSQFEEATNTLLTDEDLQLPFYRNQLEICRQLRPELADPVNRGYTRPTIGMLRNFGILAAEKIFNLKSTDIISHRDDDDIIFPGYTKQVVAALQEQNVDWIRPFQYLAYVWNLNPEQRYTTFISTPDPDKNFVSNPAASRYLINPKLTGHDLPIKWPDFAAPPTPKEHIQELVNQGIPETKAAHYFETGIANQMHVRSQAVGEGCVHSYRLGIFRKMSDRDLEQGSRGGAFFPASQAEDCFFAEGIRDRRGKLGFFKPPIFNSDGSINQDQATFVRTLGNNTYFSIIVDARSIPTPQFVEEAFREFDAPPRSNYGSRNYQATQRLASENLSSKGTGFTVEKNLGQIKK